MSMLLVSGGAEAGYSPVGVRDDGSTQVELGHDHPGVADPVYRERRNAIAAEALRWQAGDPAPTIAYSEAENATWRTLNHELRAAWAEHADPSFLDSVERLGLPADRVPQLAEVSALLAPHSGFRYLPVAGLAPLRHFYASFGDDTFWSTQYLRHDSQPLYTPEPDLCHEVLGHANQLADARIADLYRRVAACVGRLETDAALGALSKVFWFTVEFGVVAREGEQPKTWGAGLLSSFGELGALGDAELRPFDTASMATMTYDITRYQPVLFAARSLDAAIDGTAAFLESFDDEAAARLAHDRL